MKVILETYNAEWRSRFGIYQRQIKDALNTDVLAIEHIGSTSVIGLSAKPVIDIQVGVRDKTTLDAIVGKMIQGGFTYAKKYEHLLPERRYFIRYEHQTDHTPPEILADDTVMATGFTNVAHIHCWIFDSEDCVRHIAFRDYLRAHESVRAEYQTLKEELAKKEWDSSLEYSNAKNDFIQKTEKIAIDWYRSRST